MGNNCINTIKSDKKTVDDIKEKYCSTINSKETLWFEGCRMFDKMVFYENKYGSFIQFPNKTECPVENIETLSKQYPDAIFEWQWMDILNVLVNECIYKNGEILTQDVYYFHRETGARISLYNIDEYGAIYSDLIAANGPDCSVINVPNWYGFGLYAYYD